jgi:hypothetical protein
VVADTTLPLWQTRPVRSTTQRAVQTYFRRIVGDATTRQIVIMTAIVMVAVQLVFRAWAIYYGWFYGDDLKFLSEAATTPLSLDYLFTRHQQQLMPGGLLITWLVGQGPAYSWPLAATTILAMQALASAGCVLMLSRLFGWRPGILLPLGLYLFSPLTLGAYMWWAAALNQLPLQIAFFGIICTHLAYVRTRNLRWAAASAAILALGLLFYIKAVVMVPLLALLTVLYFVEGKPVARVRAALARFWPVWVGYALVAGGYLGAYASTGSSPVGTKGDAAYLETTDRQVRETLGSTLTGGPWRWLAQGRQDVLAHPPEFAVTLAWLAIAAVVVGTSWRRVGAWRAWALLVAYLVPTVFLTASGRTTLFGPDVGLYVRYVTDVAVVACLVLGLATMPLRGASERLRTLDPPVTMRPLAALGAVAFLIGSVCSSFTYVSFWHADSPAERYIRAATNDLRPLDSPEVIDEPVPDNLVLAPNAPFNRPSKLLAPLEKSLRPVSSGTDLRMFGTDGQLGSALVTPGIKGRIRPGSDCGVLVSGSDPVSIPMRGTVTNDRWWMSISYLSSRDGEMTVLAGDNRATLPVNEGPHTVFLRTSGPFDQVDIATNTSKLGLCVDTITVGFIGTFS